MGTVVSHGSHLGQMAQHAPPPSNLILPQVEDYKRLVLSYSSELHRATDQLLFMPDPNDPTFTILRFMSTVKATDWRATLALGRPLREEGREV